ncbi:hypothetical protein GJ496_009025 [Pomphorhynchus laevis]|nr:hypothetical protein GJ496_009025 [Pomphorhynchus laevis]
MDKEHVIGIAVETDDCSILKLKEFNRNSNLVCKENSQNCRLTDSRISLSIFRFILAEILPMSAILQQALCDSLTDRNIELTSFEIDNIRKRTVLCCKSARPILNKPQNISLQRDQLRTTTGRLLQHDDFITPDIYQFSGTLHFYRLAKHDISNKHLMLPFVPISFNHKDLIRIIRSVCSKRTLVLFITEEIKQPAYYHAILTFKSVKESLEFNQFLSGQLITCERRRIETVNGNLVDEPIQYKVTSVPVRFIHAVPHVDRITADDVLELPTCVKCLSNLDESVINWQQTPFALLRSHIEHCIGCPGRIAASYTLAHCSACEETEDLWLCMICGNVACSRYKRSHGIQHCTQTGHSLTVKLSSFSGDSPFIWDYATDACVQRLISFSSHTDQNKVELQCIENSKTETINIEQSNIQGITCESVNSDVGNVENKIVELGQSQNISVEKKAVTILELNALYTSAIEHVNNINDIVISDLRHTYTNEVNQLEAEIEQLKHRWKNVGGEKGAAQKLKRRKEYLKSLESNLEEEKELNKCLLSNLEENTTKLKNKKELYERSKQLLADASKKASELMLKVGP